MQFATNINSEPGKYRDNGGSSFVKNPWGTDISRAKPQGKSSKDNVSSLPASEVHASKEGDTPSR